jgi:serine/threonine protein kinase
VIGTCIECNIGLHHSYRIVLYSYACVNMKSSLIIPSLACCFAINFYLQELCSGGDLYSRDPYTEEESARITSSILSAVSYMHSKGIIHRDLKYENILFIDNNPQAEIKLIDFGLSKRFGHEELTEGVGTV